MMMKHSLLALAGALFVGTATNAALVPPAGVDTILYDWNFDGDGVAGGTVDSGASGTDWVKQNVTSLRNNGWTVFGNAGTGSNNSNAFYVDTDASRLTLKDVENVNTPAPVLTLGEARPRGFVETSIGTLGAQTQQIQVHLRSGSTTLARFDVWDNDEIRVHDGSAGTGYTSYVNSTGWFDAPQPHQFSWTVDEDGTGGQFNYFFDLAGTTNDISRSIPFMTAGVPDRIMVSVGFYSAVDRGAIFDDLTVMVPEPASLSLVALAGGLLVARRRRH